MNDDLSDLVLFGDGWHLIEFDDTNSHVWSTRTSEIWFEYDFEKVELNIDCFHLNIHPITIARENAPIIVEKLVGGANKILVPLNGSRKLIISSDTFIPKDVIKESNDPRELGVRLYGLCVYFNGMPYRMEVRNIKSKRYVDLRNQLESYELSRYRIGGSKKFNQFFDKVYCISCNNDFNRRLHAIKEFTSAGIDFEFVPAIPTNLIPDKIGISPEEASLCLTSKFCIDSAKMNGYSSIVIMEDDFKFNDNWMEMFIDFQYHLPDNWDLLYLGQSEWWGGISDKKVESVNNHVDRIGFGCGAHFIGIKESIFDLCSVLIGTLNEKLDICYWNIMRDKNYNSYSPKKSLADSLSSPDKRFVDKIPGFTISNYFPSRLSNL